SCGYSARRLLGGSTACPSRPALLRRPLLDLGRQLLEIGPRAQRTEVGVVLHVLQVPRVGEVAGRVAFPQGLDGKNGTLLGQTSAVALGELAILASGGRRQRVGAGQVVQGVGADDLQLRGGVRGRRGAGVVALVDLDAGADRPQVRAVRAAVEVVRPV